MFVQELMEECHISVVAAREAAADTGQTVQILVITRKKSCLELRVREVRAHILKVVA